MELISKEIHLIDRIFGMLAYPVLYPIKRYKHRNFLGKFSGGMGIVTIKYRFFDWGRFSIDCIEPRGENWIGKYRLIDDICLTGKYRWNVGKNRNVVDIGEHILYVSEDGCQIKGSWEELTGLKRSGPVLWNRLEL